MWPPLRTLAIAAWGLRGYGTGHVPAGGTILAANHQSFLDPLLIGLAISTRQLHFIARRTLFRFPPFAWAIRGLNAHPIDRGRGDLAAIRVTLEILRAGGAIVMFPEGTRTHTGRLGPIKLGVTRIAARAGVPVVPVLVEGSRIVWPRSNPLPMPGPVNIIFGPSMKASESFPGPEDYKDMWIQLSRAPHRRIVGGFPDGQS